MPSSVSPPGAGRLSHAPHQSLAGPLPLAASSYRSPADEGGGGLCAQGSPRGLPGLAAFSPPGLSTHQRPPRSALAGPLPGRCSLFPAQQALRWGLSHQPWPAPVFPALCQYTTCHALLQAPTVPGGCGLRVCWPRVPHSQWLGLTPLSVGAVTAASATKAGENLNAVASLLAPGKSFLGTGVHWGEPLTTPGQPSHYLSCHLKLNKDEADHVARI